MKLSEYFPELPQYLQKQTKLNSLINSLEIMKASKDGAEVYRSPTVGLDFVVNTWVRQQMAYRMNLVQDLYTLAQTVEEIRSPILHIVGEVFRRGIKWAPKFAVKCQECDIEYVDMVPECKKCKSPNALKEPNEDQKTVPNEFLKDCNIFDQALEEVLRVFWFDVNALDTGFLYIAKEYIEDGPIKVRSKPLEIRRIHPALIEFDLDTRGLPKNSHWLCYIHRNLSPSLESGKCRECNRDLVPAMYRMYRYGGGVTEGQQVTYLLDSEIILCKKFNTDELYGFSPILTVFEKALTIIGMDRNLYRFFWERQMPASMLMVFTDDPASIRREREQIVAKMRQDPNYIPMMAVSSRNNRGRVDMVRLFHTLQEMDYLPVRHEIRERIASMWGVTPAWQGAPEAYGGLSGTTQQLTVMSRVSESDQRLIQEKVFPNLLEAFGVTDWVWELPSPEEKAEATRIMFSQQRVSVASQLLQMGFTIKIKSADTGIDDIDFVVSGDAKSQQDMFSGGMFGNPSGGLSGGAESEGEGEAQGDSAQQFQLMEKSNGKHQDNNTWLNQLSKAGYQFPVIKEMIGNKMLFASNGDLYVAKFNSGGLVNVSKFVSPLNNFHSHNGTPPHSKFIAHNNNNNPDKKVLLEESDKEDSLEQQIGDGI